MCTFSAICEWKKYTIQDSRWNPIHSQKWMCLIDQLCQKQKCLSHNNFTLSLYLSLSRSLLSYLKRICSWMTGWHDLSQTILQQIQFYNYVFIQTLHSSITFCKLSSWINLAYYTQTQATYRNRKGIILGIWWIDCDINVSGVGIQFFSQSFVNRIMQKLESNVVANIERHKQITKEKKV